MTSRQLLLGAVALIAVVQTGGPCIESQRLELRSGREPHSPRLAAGGSATTTQVDAEGTKDLFVPIFIMDRNGDCRAAPPEEIRAGLQRLQEALSAERAR